MVVFPKNYKKISEAFYSHLGIILNCRKQHTYSFFGEIPPQKNALLITRFILICFASTFCLPKENIE